MRQSHNIDRGPDSIIEYFLELSPADGIRIFNINLFEELLFLRCMIVHNIELMLALRLWELQIFKPLRQKQSV